MANLFKVEVEGVGKLARDFDRADRRLQNKINRTMREIEKVVTPVLKAEAPHETGALADSIEGSIFFRGNVVRVTFRAGAKRDGFDYLPVTRFGHVALRIFPKRAKALTVPGRGRAGRTVLRSSVAGYRPSHDWVDVAAKAASKVVTAEARKLNREIDTVMFPVTSEQAVQRLIEWVQSVLPELVAAYDHVPAAKPGGMPDCVVEAARTGIDDLAATRFRFWRLQQRNVYYVEANVSFMVDNTDTAAAAAQLRDFEARLFAALLKDATLGGRVPIASPLVEFDFTAPFVEYEDGTKGREMTMTIAVGDLVEATT